MLTTCHQCGHEVSEEARRCPSCSARLKEGTGTDPLMRGRGKADLALAVMLALVVVGVVCAGCGPLGLSEPATERVVVENRSDVSLEVLVCPGQLSCAPRTAVAWFEQVHARSTHTRELAPAWDESGVFTVQVRPGDVFRSYGTVDREGPVTRVILEPERVP